MDQNRKGLAIIGRMSETAQEQGITGRVVGGVFIEDCEDVPPRPLTDVVGPREVGPFVQGVADERGFVVS